MDKFFENLPNTPLTTILIVAGLLFILLGFVTKIGGFIEVSPEQKRWTIPIGLLVLFIGLFLNIANEPNTEISSTEPAPEISPAEPAPETSSAEPAPETSSAEPAPETSSGWQICNQNNEEEIYVAVVYKDDHDLIRKGWYEISQGECKEILSTLDNNHTVYYYAEGKKTKRKVPKGKGDSQFCIHPNDKFSLYHVKQCNDPYKIYQFIKKNTKDNKFWKTTIN